MPWRWLVPVVLFFGLLSGVACSSTTGDLFAPPSADAGDEAASDDDGGCMLGCDAPTGALSITPMSPVLNVVYGQTTPTVTFTALMNGNPVTATWEVDRGERATITSGGVLSPTGNLGGGATVTATVNNIQATTTVTLFVSYEQNGDPDGGVADGGAGGVGGIGGEGSGAPVSAGTLSVLKGAPTSDPGLGWIYPYDKTVWPRAILAPLTQWNVGSQGDYDAVYIHAHESQNGGGFDYKGYFTKTATPFIHHPIPQTAWKALQYSNEGEDLTVDLVFAKGNVAYGPITEKWKIAPGNLRGTVYYQSYGTALAPNYTSTWGAATLGIKHGATDPTLVAGNKTACRVCHAVSGDGSTLVTGRGDNSSGVSAYNLKTTKETQMSPDDGRFAWPALYKDGSFLFSNSATGWTGSSPPGMVGATTAPSALFDVPSGSPVSVSGLPSGLGAATPVFSPDGKHVAFNYFRGPAGDEKSLATMDFDAATKTFSNLKVRYTPSQGTAVWPSYMPTNDAIVFELETVSNGRDFGGTRSSCDGPSCNDGVHAELWWIDLTAATPTARRLDALNGKGYLPTGPNGHGDDATLSYEPTVNPLVSGGYAWIVMTSRRLYGNVATINPYWSDPRFHAISTTPTTKKLWVAAIDLKAPPGTDPSHPAFYLPGQELLAGNSRGYWVLDPCMQDGTTCETGDECCGGFCRSSGGTLVCQPPTGCANESEKCTTAADCCVKQGGVVPQCIGGYCDGNPP